MQQKDLAFLPHFNGKIQEIRSMGYDFIGALLELTDNSARCDCNSSNIDVVIHSDQKQLSRISVIDDGRGMTFEGLKQAIVFNLLKHRDHGDIGKFHVGLKYASIVIGDHITILTHQAGNTVSGIHLDITQMKELNTFTPTDMRETVDEAWALTHIHPNDYVKFCQQSSGTIVSIKSLTPMCRRNIDKIKDELIKILPFSYSMLYNGCVMNLYEGDMKLSVIEPYDMFYKNSPQNLDESAYETELQVYRDLAGIRVFEINKNKRIISQHINKTNQTKGTFTNPVFYEYTSYIVGKKGHQNNMVQVNVLPENDTLIATIPLYFVQVNEQTFKSEKSLFPVGSKLIDDRKGVFFVREIRQVCAAHQLGKKFPDRDVMASERQRCLTIFKSDADDLVGSKYNKHMDGLLALPCTTLNDAIHAIYKQVTNVWKKKWPGKKKQEDENDDDDDSNVDDNTSDSQSDSSNTNTQTVAQMMSSNTNINEISVPLDTETNQTVPLDTETNQSVPLDTETNQSVPLDTETNQSVPLDTETNQSVPLDTDLDEDYTQNHVIPSLPSSEDERDYENLSVTSSVPSLNIDTNDEVEPSHVPVYSELLVNDDIVFMEDNETIGTLKSVPYANLLYTWFRAMNTTNVEAYKNYRYMYLQAQN